jgi:protein-L-isoaspartate(D-aspartate) O-methyltransferase
MVWWRVAVVTLLVAGCTGQPSSSTLPTEPPASVSADGDQRSAERMRMVEDQVRGRGVSDPAVLAALGTVPRHRFVGDDWQRLAYGDHPLPIGHGQTISQPLVVALMSQVLESEPGARVLEIGTGSGYQAAVLAAMDLEVYSVEIIPELAERAETTLHELGYDVTSRTADGYLGWPEEAPFDGIMVTAAPDHVPQPLVEQLAPDGVMVIPVGPIGAVQTLWRFTKDADGELIGESLGPVAFVPLTRAEG